MNNNNKKYAKIILNRRSFELSDSEIRCLSKVLRDELDRQKFICILKRYRALKYHIN